MKETAPIAVSNATSAGPNGLRSSSLKCIVINKTTLTMTIRTIELIRVFVSMVVLVVVGLFSGKYRGFCFAFYAVSAILKTDTRDEVKYEPNTAQTKT